MTGFPQTRPGVLHRLARSYAAVALPLFALASPALAYKPRVTQPSTPMARVRRWFQTGPASWYGRGLEGNRTASGEPFHANALTCAHPTLPLGTWVRVTNLRNRRSVFVRVTDRGPWFGNRIVDLSSAAAHALAFTSITRVALEPVTPRTPELERALSAQVATPTPISADAWASLQPFPLAGRRLLTMPVLAVRPHSHG